MNSQKFSDKYLQCHQNYEQQFSKVAFSMFDITQTLFDRVSYMQEDILLMILDNQNDRWLFFLLSLQPNILKHLQIPTGLHYLTEVTPYTWNIK